MKKSVLMLSHFFFWVSTFFSTPYMFTIVWMVAASWEQPKPYKITHIETAYGPTFILMLIGAGIFYASYFSLRFFLKHPILFAGLFAVYVLYDLVVSLPADWV